MRADVIVVNLEQLHSSPRHDDLVSALVYSAVAADVWTTIIDGRVLMRNGELQTLDEDLVIDEANREAEGLRARAGITR